MGGGGRGGMGMEDGRGERGGMEDGREREETEQTGDRRGREGKLGNVVCQFHLIVCLHQVRLDSNNAKCE